MAKITKELQDTVRSKPNLKKVYFDASGRHYFYAHELVSGEGSDKKEKYGAGAFSHRQLIPGMNTDNVYESVSKGDHPTKITEILTREEILNGKVESSSTLVQQAMNASPEELAALRAIFGAGTTPVGTVEAPKTAPKSATPKPSGDA